MPFTPVAETGSVPDSWRSLAPQLTPAQVRRLAAMERHPAYTGRPGFLVLEALEYVQPGWAADYLTARATSR
ncbi:hypothetical protein BVC93_29405 [Mycobacterium sp. MS1601]|uniref:hypothetical protein n=1 Tax=Mycobacterium sp. MS1601 TaxID=1936029 RepID=UPI00097980C3|nr:hypothetical protein [Mycobacterium sp. MS1601]AQA05801.1 hypothetical protein BVC93_29405 [Mycobacterium sp. MS1601]